MKTKNVEDIYPLTPRQRAVLDASVSGASPSRYTEVAAWAIEGRLDAETYERAWRLAAERHAALRTSFAWQNLEEPLQVVRARVNLVLAVEDWRGLGAEESRARLAGHLARERESGFDLSDAPLARLSLLRTADDAQHLVWSHPGILFDRRSVALVFDEVLALYEALAAGVERKAAPPVPFSRFVVWGRRHDFSRAEAHWRRALGGLEAGAARLAPERADGEAAHARAEELAPLPPETAAALARLARSHELSPETVYAGAWAVLLSRYGDAREVLFGEEVEGRAPGLPGAESIVGMLADTLPLRVRVEPAAPLAGWLKSLEEQRAAAAGEAFAPLERIRRWAGAPDGGSLFDSVVAFQTDGRAAAGAGLAATPVESVGRGASPDGRLTVAVKLGEPTLIRIVYDAAQFEAGAVRRMLVHFLTLLEGIAADPAATTGELEMLTKEELRRLLFDWNRTAADYPPGLALHELFEAAADRAPQAVALVAGEERLTYAELEARANRLANYLRSLGVGPDVPVGVLMERSAEMVVALLGVLKAGGAYLPLDPSYPAERLRHMLEDARPPVVLAQRRLLDLLPGHAPRVVCLGDAEEEEFARGEGARPAAGVAADNLAYVIYTSGSTGVPKGAMNTHGGIVNRLLWMQDEYRLAPEDVVLQKTPYSFDVSVWEFFWPLMAGARLVLAEPGGHQDPAYLADLIRSEGVTTLHFVPSMLQHFIEEPGAEKCRGLRRVVCSGEALPYELQRRFHARLPWAELHNLYGPTEAAVDVTFWECRPDDGLRTVPIGRPVANTQIYLLDGRLGPTPVGVGGELHIGGVQLARGYLNRPALTAEKFIPDPFSAEPGARMYRTGDLARFLPDGEIEYVGRLDFQVKLRGFRIELGEVEAALVAHPSVRECVAVVRDRGAGDGQLVAYVVSAGGPVAAGELRDFVRRRLPEYMTPSRFVLLDELPLTPNGKVDRRALPAPEAGGGDEGVAYEPPRTAVQELLAGVWAEVLGVERVGLNDNFFRLGGHSLLATQVVLRVREVFGADLPLRLIFELPTVAAVAEHIETMSWAADGTARLVAAGQPLEEGEL